MLAPSTAGASAHVLIRKPTELTNFTGHRDHYSIGRDIPDPGLVPANTHAVRRAGGMGRHNRGRDLQSLSETRR